MRILTYLGFTLLSVLIQFCVMDYIKEQSQIDDENITSQNRDLNEFLEEVTSRPHALYYRTKSKRFTHKNKSPTKLISNSTMPQMVLESSTDLTSTIIDILYDENVSVTESFFTTDQTYTTTELDNFTDITLMDKSNDTIRPKFIPKRILNKDCSCNLLYKVCDINCCCDTDCLDEEKKLFESCIQNFVHKEKSHYYCNLQVPFEVNTNFGINTLFCVAKTNLPEKRNIHKYDASVLSKSFRWHTDETLVKNYEFSRQIYKYNDPIWLLQNGSIYYIDIPTPTINKYCNSRAPVKFLKDERIVCDVKLKDLEMFHITKSYTWSKVISVAEKSLNNTGLNCSSLHCVNWTLMACEETTPCVEYNKSFAPLCTESFCTNIALSLDYIISYYNFEIVNVTVKMYMTKVSTILPFLTQEINVKFYLANEFEDSFVRFSGNPGYQEGLPVIVSYSESNHTEYFFNNIQVNHLLYPNNIQGVCVVLNDTKNAIKFGINKRTKCRISNNLNVAVHNDTDICKSIQHNIETILGLQNKIVVSPFGNPHEISDKDWIPLQTDTYSLPVHGKLDKKESILYCYNLVTRIGLVFTFADVSDKDNKRENKILSARLEVTTYNISFVSEDLSMVITVDSIFIDQTKGNMNEYAAGPHLNIHLPKDFFFPFSSNFSFNLYCNKCVLILSILILIIK